MAISTEIDMKATLFFSLLYVCEVWLSYVFWSLLSEQVASVFFFSLIQTGAAITSFLYPILGWLLPPLLLVVPYVRTKCKRWVSLLRLPYLIPIVVGSVVDPQARAVCVTIAVAFGLISIALVASSIDEDEEHERPSERARFFFGIIAGLFLKNVMSFGAFSDSPLLLNIATQAVFGIMTAAATVPLIIHELKKREGERLNYDTIETAGLDEIEQFCEIDMACEQEDELRPNAFQHEYWLWIPVGLSYGSMLMLTIWYFFNVGMANTWSGNGDPYPVVLAPLFLMLVGVLVARHACDTVYWIALFFIGGGLSLHVDGGGGVFGTCLLALGAPVALLAVFNMFGRGYTWPAMFLGHLIAFIFLVFYLGVDTGANSLIGGPFLGAPFKLGWIVICLSSLLWLITLILRSVLADDSEDLVSRLLVPKMHRPNARRIIVIIVLFVVLLIAIIVRGAVDGRPDRTPLREDEVRIATYNTFLGYSAVTGRSNLKAVSNILWDYSVDIVGMQESDSWDGYARGASNVEYAEHLLNFPHSNHGAPSKSGTYNCAILSDLPLSNSGYADLTSGLLDGCPDCLNRVMVYSDIDFGSRIVRVVTVHLDFVDNSTQLLQAQDAKNYADQFPGPAIVMGDFNAEPGSATYDLFVNDGYGNAVLDATGSQPRTFERCWKGSCSIETLDYIFYKGLVLVDAEVIESSLGVSDHLAVVATFAR